MIKLTAMAPSGNHRLILAFSDGSSGQWAAADLLTHDTELTRPLFDPAYFARAFIEAGALAWPNGLELSAWSLQNELREAGKLVAAKAA